LPTQRNEVWSIDFVIDALSHGRVIKILTIVNDCTREAIGLVADFEITWALCDPGVGSGGTFLGYSKAIRTDLEPQFSDRALGQWAYKHNFQLKLIQPGKLTQYPYIESFVGAFRDE
jgi:putative transposase